MGGFVATGVGRSIGKPAVSVAVQRVGLRRLGIGGINGGRAFGGYEVVVLCLRVYGRESILLDEGGGIVGGRQYQVGRRFEQSVLKLAGSLLLVHFGQVGFGGVGAGNQAVDKGGLAGGCRLVGVCGIEAGALAAVPAEEVGHRAVYEGVPASLQAEAVAAGVAQFAVCYLCQAVVEAEGVGAGLGDAAVG